MKGCIKDFLNLLDSNRERIAISIFCVLLCFQKYCRDMETRLISKPLYQKAVINSKTIDCKADTT